MASHPAVLDDPAPSVFVESGDAEGLSMQGYCWVANADFMAARSEIWRELDRTVAAREDFQLALPGQRITLEERPAG